MTAAAFNVGAYVAGPPTSTRGLARHAELFTAYAEGELDDGREAYLSHFVFGPEMTAHFRANGRSVAGFAGPCCCRWLILDIDRADLGEALADARRLVTAIHARYPELVDVVPVYFSGGKGFHVVIELSHAPPPAVGFHHVAKTFSVALSAAAGVRIDTGIFDVNHIVRLPNTRHPRTGLFKRLIEPDALFLRDLAGHLADARHPNPAAIPKATRPVPQLAADWQAAERETARAAVERSTVQRSAEPDALAPRWLIDFLRFGTGEGDRHRTLFRAAAWLTEQGAPLALCSALLTEPGRDVGLTPKDVARQIQCGIEHARRQSTADDPRPDPAANPEGFERWAVRHEAEPLEPGALDFPFGSLAQTSEGGPTA